MAPDRPGTRPSAIATPHVAATAAGRAAFEAGGNAVDAALAAACTLTVVYPHMCVVGGDVMALVHDGEAHAVNGSGRAPAGLRPGPVPLRGVDSITVPGAARAWQTLAEAWGTQPLSPALRSAAALARRGIAVAPSLAKTLATAGRWSQPTRGCQQCSPRTACSYARATSWCRSDSG